MTRGEEYLPRAHIQLRKMNNYWLRLICKLKPPNSVRNSSTMCPKGRVHSTEVLVKYVVRMEVI